jgi:hypothetical protein
VAGSVESCGKIGKQRERAPAAFIGATGKRLAGCAAGYNPVSNFGSSDGAVFLPVRSEYYEHESLLRRILQKLSISKIGGF